MSVDPRKIPAVNEKPTSREVLASLPFVWRMIWAADRASVLWQAFGAALVFTAYSGWVVMMGVVTTALEARDPARIWMAVGLIALFEVCDVLSDYVAEYFSDRLRYRTELAIKQRQFAHIQRLPYWVLEHPSFRALQHALDQKGWLVLSFANEVLGFVRDLAMALGALAAVVFLPWQATIALLASQVVALYLGQKAGDYQWSLLSMETRVGRRASYYAQSVNSLAKLQVMQPLGLTRAFLRRWSTISTRLLEERLRVTGTMARAVGWSGAIRAIGFVYGLWVLVQGYLGSTVALGVIVMFLSSYHSIGMALGRLVRNASWFQKEAPFFVLFKQFYDLPHERETGKLLPKQPLSITFDHVWFRYPGSGDDVLRDVTFTFNEGDHLALVGLNGAGKSTLLKLLLGVYEPTRGKILVNGVDLQAVKPAAWREALAVMTQQNEAFDDAIREQIKYGDYDRKEDPRRLKQALAVSGMAGIAKEFSRGVETHAGKYYAMEEDEAIELSGGQNQILAIARTLYRNARVYIFDEPTSAVDAEKEERFFEQLPSALQGQAVLFVSHRFSTLRRAERILVLEHGRLIEDGTHEELLAKKGRYAALFTLQAKMYQ